MTSNKCYYIIIIVVTRVTKKGVKKMGRKRKNTNYRQYYKDYFGIEFGSEMAVHHIDFDRSNNDINNLLLLPSRLHSKYHFALSMLFGLDKQVSLIDEMRLSGPMVTAHYPQWLRIMADTLEEVQPWIQMKIDFETLPEDVFKSAYHTGTPITERTVR